MTNETRLEVILKSNGFCHCGKVLSIDTVQIAHRIHKGRQAENHIIPYLERKFNRDFSRKWVQDNILENSMNLVAVCSSKCNDKCNIFFKPVERDNLIDEIMKLKVEQGAA